MWVQCKRDSFKFEAEIKSRKSYYFDKDGDRFIECPMCQRRYYYMNDGQNFEDEDRKHNGTWYCDRILTILPESKNPKANETP